MSIETPKLISSDMLHSTRVHLLVVQLLLTKHSNLLAYGDHSFSSYQTGFIIIWKCMLTHNTKLLKQHWKRKTATVYHNPRFQVVKQNYYKKKGKLWAQKQPCWLKNRITNPNELPTHDFWQRSQKVTLGNKKVVSSRNCDAHIGYLYVAKLK